MSSDDKVIKVDRRSLIKNALIIGGGAYAAPLILGTATPASAQVVSATCSTSSCTGPLCGGPLDCFCISVAGGGFGCADPVCTNDPCTTTADCGTNEVCFTSGCCVEESGPGSFCVPLCGTTQNGTPASATLQSVRKGSAWRH